MNIIDITTTLLPKGTDGRWFLASAHQKTPLRFNLERCPIWPPDVFAVVGTLIERSGCYTEAGPEREHPLAHRAYLSKVKAVVKQWSKQEESLFNTPAAVDELWKTIVITHAKTEITDVIKRPDLVKALIMLFAISDETCRGMGWDSHIGDSIFSDLALMSLVKDVSMPPGVPSLPWLPNSLCALVSPAEVIVLPKTLTATVGCTIRSLSHHLALLPGISQCRPEWALANQNERGDAYRPIRLLVIPFPYAFPSHSFTLVDDPHFLTKGNSTAAYFGLDQQWLQTAAGPISARMLFDELIAPLMTHKDSYAKDRRPLTGIVIPECALSQSLADELAALLSQTGLSFFTTGILTTDAATNKSRNLAKTYVFAKDSEPIALTQYKQHRWRLDQTQCEQYGLDFQRLSKADRWWEDIDVSERKLPFFALRKDMSMTVLICEDLARNDPAMSVVRAIGPNLLIALLMDGPQLKERWPGRHATVLGEDPGTGVLSVTCAAMVDRSNDTWLRSAPDAKPRRVVGLWRGEENSSKEIELPNGYQALVLNIESRLTRQHTLDNRSDRHESRKLSMGRVIPLQLENPPDWIC